MSNLIANSTSEDEQGVLELYDEVPRVLHTLLHCLSQTKLFIHCIAQDYANNPNYRGNLFSSQITDTIIEALKEAINSIVLSHYQKIHQYRFSPEYAPLLQEFVVLQH